MRRNARVIPLVAALIAFWPTAHANAQTAAKPGTQLITLGTRAGPGPSALAAQASSLLIVNGALYLIDAGDGTARQLARAGIKYTEIGQIFITHPHNDHVAGLGTLLSVERQYGRKDPIHVYGPRGVEQIVAATIQYFTPDADIRWDEGLHSEMKEMFRGHDVATGLVYQDANVKVTAVENSHFKFTPEGPAYGKYKSYSYRFETPDKVVVFTGDTGPSAAVEELAKNADILVAEIMVPDDVVQIQKRNGVWDKMSPERQKEYVRHLTEEHLLPEDVGRLASKANAKRVVVSHSILTGNDEADAKHFLEGIKKLYSGQVELAKDLMRF